VAEAKRLLTPPTEKEALAWLAAREDGLIDLAREFIAAPSPNPPGDERAAADVGRRAMEALGYSAVRVVAKAEERPNIIGEVGTGPRSIAFNGHLDTKPPGETGAWKTLPYDPVISDGRLYGLGATDMKGALAAMIYAGAAVGRAQADAGVVHVVLSADEEATSEYGAVFLSQAGAVKADACVVCESTGIEYGWEYVGVATRGISCFRITTRGTQMHDSLSDHFKSVNASVKLAQVIVRMADEFTLPEGATLNLGVMLSGGVFWGVYPGEASCAIDVRAAPGMTFDQLTADVEAFLTRLKAEDPELDVVAEWEPGLEWCPPAVIDLSHPLVDAACSAARDILGREVPPRTMPGATDGPHWVDAGMTCLPALGPGLLPLAHRPNEYVEVQEVIEAARIYALTALRYFRQAEMEP
jgi:acetylornithine deacetylase/succinyl-diaminopimelate desuccinylase-like protein